MRRLRIRFRGYVLTADASAFAFGGQDATLAKGSTMSAPTNTVLPAISGAAQVGQTLSSSTGTWTGFPTAYFYQWRRNGSSIAGATAATYLIGTSDVGTVITVAVTAVNGAGSSTPAISAGTSAVSEAFSAPVNTSVPLISGVPEVGQTLSATTGAWTGNPTPTYAYQWVRGASDIGGATSAIYVAQSADIGSTLRVRVTATNSQGSASALSAATSAVTAAGVPVQLATLSLVNTSGSQQASGFVSPFFGHAFKKGDVPSGTWPRFELADGTLLAYTMWNRASWNDGSLKFAGFMVRVPTTIAGSGTLTINVKNNGSAPGTSARSTADLSALNLSVDLVGTANLSGTWTSSLSQGITDNDFVELLADGGAGKIWRIRQQFMQGGANHGQLECFWYVCAMQDGSGGLAGVRVMGRITQPWLDVDTPAKTHDRSMTATLKAGSTTIRSLNSGTAFRLPHFCSVFTCDVDGRYDFRAGTQASEATVRVLPSKVYLRSTKVIPPYDLTVSPTADATYSYLPMSRGPLEAFQDGTGYHVAIGPAPEWAARYFIAQSATSERACRVAALSHGAMNLNVRRSSTQQVPVLNNTTYAGMGAAAPTMRWRPDPAVGFTAPSGNWKAATWDTNQGSWNTSHWPVCTFPALVITGEPQYMDMQMEDANNAVITREPGFERNFTVGGTTYYGVCQNDGYQLRTDAWGLKEIFYAAGMVPDDHVAQPYFKALAAVQFDYHAAWSASLGASWVNYGGTWTAAGELTGRPWQTSFLLMAVATGYALTEDADALTMLNYVVRWYNNLRTQASLHLSTAASDVVFTSGSTFNTTTLVKQLSDYYATVGITGAGGFFSHNYVGNPGEGSFLMQADDVFIFTSSAPAGFSTFTKYYTRDINNGTRQFRLASSPGGAAITVPTGSWSGGVRMAGPQTSFGLEYNNEGGHTAHVYAAIRWAEALGATNAPACRTVLDNMKAAASFNFTSNPKLALWPSFS